MVGYSGNGRYDGEVINNNCGIMEMYTLNMFVK
jgi:hypothetical protein